MRVMLDTNILISSFVFKSKRLNKLIENVDILISGDKDFEDIVIDKPEILKPAEFLSKYYNED